MDQLIDYTKVKTTKAMFAAHLLNARILVSDTKLIAQEALKRFGRQDEEATLAVLKEANDTLTMARRHGLNCTKPIGNHNGNKYGVIRGQVTFLKHFERDRSFT